MNNKEIINRHKQIMNGEIDTYSIVEFFKAIETTEIDIPTFVEIVKKTKEKMIAVDIPAHTLDTAGTGGDGHNTFNISTITSIITAAVGIPTTKHGNRSASGKCGSADVLEALGAKIEHTPEEARYCFEKCDFTFLFAPNFHPVLANAKDARKQYGKPTYFNLMGPLLNPANPKVQVIGVVKEDNQELIANVVKSLGMSKVAVIRGYDGLDEISVETPSYIYKYIDGFKSELELSPDKFEVEPHSLNGIKGGDKGVNTKIFRDVLNGTATEAQTNVVLLNAGFAISLYKDISIKKGIEVARNAIENKIAIEKLNQYISISNSV